MASFLLYSAGNIFKHKNKAMRLTNTYLLWSRAIQHGGLALSFSFC